MHSQRRQRTYVIVTGFMAVLMITSAILPSLQRQQNTQTQPTPQPTEVPIPTFPAPINDFSTISFGQRYMHPSGLFTVAEPTGWTPISDSNNGTFVQVNMNNEQAKSVIETYIEIPTEPIDSLDALNAHFTTENLESSWRNYSTPAETGRFKDEANNRVLIDFELSLGRQTYVARHSAELKDGWIYVTRVVTPNNALDLLRFMVDQMPKTIEKVELFADTPSEQIAWTTYYSDQESLIIRHPEGWSVVDGGPGGPVSIAGGNGEVLRIETVSGVKIENEAAATEYVEALRPGISVISVVPTTRNGADGFSVAYSSTTLEGERESGLAVLLNGPDDTLYVANVRAQGIEGLDLNNPGEDQAHLVGDLTGTMASFNLTTGYDLPTNSETVAS